MSTFGGAAIAGTGLAHAETTSITVTVPGCVVGPQDLIGWWRGDGDATAEIGPDLSGAVDNTAGLIGRAMTFDGVTSVWADGLAPVGDGLTIDLWAKPSATHLIQTLVSRWDFSGGDGASAYSLMTLPGGALMLLTDDASTRRPDILLASAPQLLDGDFHHIAATWDAMTIALYVDGTLVSSHASQGGALNAAPATPLRLGSSGGRGTAFHYAGLIDEPAIADRALSANEVRAITDAGPRAKCVDDGGGARGVVASR